MANKIITYLITSVWLVNGLLCKVLNLLPRHSKIVARILGNEYSRIATVLIGFSEVIMAIWILSAFKKRANAITQIVVIATMNMIEFLLASDLLLWGKLNAMFAFLFILVIFFNEFYFNKKIA
jgi:uncharacterized membrane protein YuzA (DUF378 family)